MSLERTFAHYKDLDQPILRSFFSTRADNCAPNLLGKMLVRRYQGETLAGIITETEAYQGEEDLGCHAKAGRTMRTAVMYGPPGHAYIYFTYGMHWLFNVVCDEVNQPAAVLIRAIEPVAGLNLIRKFRPQPQFKRQELVSHGWTDGPAKLCQALSINGEMNGIDLCDPSSDLWIADAGREVHDSEIIRTGRIGLNRVPEPWRSIPWRYQLTTTTG